MFGCCTQIDESCPNKPNIIYFRFRILPVTFLMTSFRLLDTDVVKKLLRICFGNYFVWIKIKNENKCKRK